MVDVSCKERVLLLQTSNKLDIYVVAGKISKYLLYEGLSSYKVMC